ncbi:hypothetical protein [Latilactobacillus curvatus]|uniref:hypothetical protein n=1 Tax=Latilactobacillus curvatus TaxID=28038 RepID=UPI00280A5ACE|nr:hypothetical protein [Latilactobacillus curvatus]
MPYIEKIATLFPTGDNETNKSDIVYNYNFSELPTSYAPTFKLGVFGLKRNESYSFHILVHDKDNSTIVDNFTPKITVNDENFDNSKFISDNLVASTFELKTIPFTIIENGTYQLKVVLVNSKHEDLDAAYTYFHTVKEA